MAMRVTPAKELLTLDQFLALPEAKPALEYVCDEAVQKPMPDLAHSLLQPFIWMLIFQYLQQHPIGRAGTETRCTFGSAGRMRSYVPDVCYFSFERLPLSDARTSRTVRVAPNLAVEVLSPDQDARSFSLKIQFYLRHGVQLVWVVDADRETITVFSPDQDAVVLRAGDTLTGGSVLPGFAAKVEDIMAQLVR